MKKILFLLMALFLFVLWGKEASTSESFKGDLTGTWTLIGEWSCLDGPADGTNMDVFKITQNGSSVSFHNTTMNNKFSGSLAGNIISVKPYSVESRFNPGASVKVSAYDLKISQNGNTLTGKARWNNPAGCKGETDLTFTRKVNN
jgi:hypothetical protein